MKLVSKVARPPSSKPSPHGEGFHFRRPPENLRAGIYQTISNGLNRSAGSAAIFVTVTHPAGQTIWAGRVTPCACRLATHAFGGQRTARPTRLIPLLVIRIIPYFGMLRSFPLNLSSRVFRWASKFQPAILLGLYGNPRCHFIFFKLRALRDSGDPGRHDVSSLPVLRMVVARCCIFIPVRFSAATLSAWQTIAHIPQLRASNKWRNAAFVSFGDSLFLYCGCCSTAITDTRCKT